jgi:glycosyltransferase involved in cell wall biosynthesis
MKILLLGPKYHKLDTPGQIGGVVVAFELLLSELVQQGVSCTVIDTNVKNYKNTLVAIIFIYLKLLWLIPRTQLVSLQGTANAYIFIAPFVVFYSHLFNKQVSLRRFAGNFIEEYKSVSKPIKGVINYALKNADALFFETKYLVRYFSEFNKHVYWLPNARSTPVVVRGHKEYLKKFIFLGRVRKEKGILELLETSNLLSDDYRIDIYGPIIGEFDFTKYKANYKGMLNPEDIPSVLSEYDVLVLPTFWLGEGYPGVIIEAFSVGLPVIASSLEGIKEIVEDGSNGILIEPQNVDELVDAFKFFNKDNYTDFAQNALQCFEQFNSEVVTRNFLEQLTERKFR